MGIGCVCRKSKRLLILLLHNDCIPENQKEMEKRVVGRCLGFSGYLDSGKSIPVAAGRRCGRWNLAGD